MQNPSENRIHFYNLDVLRFVAALMVVIYHGYSAYVGWFGHPEFMTAGTGPQAPLKYTADIAENAIHNFDLGVEFFFLISGFLITFLLLHEKNRTGKIHVGKFYLRRLLRIWPLYFLIVALAPWWVAYCAEKTPDYLSTALFVNNFHTIKTTAWEFPFAHFWSVCVEEHFYLFWPLLIAFIPLRRLPYLFAFIIVFSMGFRMYVWAFDPKWQFQVFLNTLSRMDVLAIGGWLAYRHFYRPIQLNFNKFIILGVYALIGLAFCTLYGKQWERVPTLVNVLLWKYIFVLIFIFVFCNYLFNPHAFFAFKKKNPVHYLGKISYGIYMYHNLLFIYIVRDIMWENQTKSSALFFGVYLGIVLVLSIVSYELVEKPFLRLKDRLAIVKSRKA